jgi:probable rRNA maturation factor
VDDDRIAELNQAYLNHTGPTNVISFPMQEGEFTDITPGLLGDVVISADTAHREAADAGMEMAVRFANCSFMGFFIWSAIDHVNSREEAAAMEQKSNELMELIGKEE